MNMSYTYFIPFQLYKYEDSSTVLIRHKYTMEVVQWINLSQL